MLRRYNIARLAFPHSLETEQRVLHDILDEQMPSVNYERGSNILKDPRSQHIKKIQDQARAKMRFLNDLHLFDSGDENEQNTILSTFFNEHRDFLDTYYQSELNREFSPSFEHRGTLDQLRENFKAELREYAEQPTYKIGPKYDFHPTTRSFEKQYMREKLHMEPRASITDDELKEFTSKHYVPNAYIVNGKIHFNMDHADFNFEKKLGELRAKRPNITEEEVLEIVEKKRERAAIHEITHFCLDRAAENGDTLAEQLKTQIKVALRLKSLEHNREWIELMEALDTVFDGKLHVQTDADYLHEGLAITMAGQRKSYEKSDPHRAVVVAMGKLLNATEHNPKIRSLLKQFEGDLSHQLMGDGKHEASYDFVRRKMDIATAERTESIDYADLCDAHGIRPKGEYWLKDGYGIERRNVHHHSPGMTQDPDEEEAGQDLATAEAENINPDTGNVSAEAMLKKITESHEKISKLNESKERLLQNFPADKRREQAVALDKVLEKFNEDIDALEGIGNNVRTLRDWPSARLEDKNECAEKFNFSDLGKYDYRMSKGSIIALDGKNAAARQETLNELNEIVTGYFAPIDVITKGFKDIAETKADFHQQQETREKFHDGTTLGWIKKRFWNSESSNIAWITVFDAMKIYNIYKDAILDRYHSKQKVRTGDAAKNWNIYSPLQPDLDKAARSANEEEVHSFKEFLEKEGFTYDQLFGPNAALERNRSNVNRAKAILEYAAEHAWLYHLDKTNGSDVYGVDYEGIFGPRTFEELVEKNNSQQESEKSKGKAKVDNYPDIHLLVEDIEHELQKKNIWMVLGIVERLQEKAKYAESNTWALVAIIKALRDDNKDGTLREVFAAGGKGLFDSIGGIGIGQSAWSLTLFKTQRHALMDWVKAGCTDEAAKAVGKKWEGEYLKPHSFIPEVIAHIENELYNNPKSFNKFGDNGLNRNVARVLAAQSVAGKNGKTVSIFDDDKIFKGYREYWDVVQTTTDPSKTDDDFFNPANGGSDMRLLGTEGVNAILECTSLGQFSNETKARGYLTQVIMLEPELKKKNPAAHANYVREMNIKLDSFFGKAVNNQNTSKTFGSYRTIPLAPPLEKFSNLNIMHELWKRGMINRERYIHFVTNLDSKAGSPAELKPLREAMDKVKKLKDDKATQVAIAGAEQAVEDILQATGPQSGGGGGPQPGGGGPRNRPNNQGAPGTAIYSTAA